MRTTRPVVPTRLELSPPAREILEGFAKSLNASMTSVVEMALAAYARASTRNIAS